MKFTLQGEIFELEDYRENDILASLIDEDHIVNLNYKEITENVTKHGLREYFKFLKFEDFTMDEEVELTFELMGYVNIRGFNLDYWKAKIQDERLREKFYTEKLWKDPLFGLTDVTHLYTPFAKKMAAELDDWKPTGTVVAGGILASLTKPEFDPQDEAIFTDCDTITVIDSYFPRGDIDLFLIDTDSIEPIKEQLEGLEDSGFTYETEAGKVIQVIKRNYRSENEVVLSFDLDASGLVLVNGRIYATHCAHYALQHKINHLDFDRAGPHYTYRLTNYLIKGFGVDMTGIDEEKIDFFVPNLASKAWGTVGTLHPFADLIIATHYPRVTNNIYLKDRAVYNRPSTHTIQRFDCLESITPDSKKQFESFESFLDNPYYDVDNSYELSPLLEREDFRTGLPDNLSTSRIIYREEDKVILQYGDSILEVKDIPKDAVVYSKNKDLDWLNSRSD